jgi:hypothetical protein
MRPMGTRDDQPDAPQSPIAAAISWLLDCIIEGFAAHGYAMDPFVDRDDRIDQVERPPKPSSRGRIDPVLTEDGMQPSQCKRVAPHEYSNGG